MRFIICLTSFLIALSMMGQELDTVRLEAVMVEGSIFHPFTTGSNTRVIDINDSDQNLAEVLSGEPSIYFKSYGNGQLSSISFRGTSAGHTSVLWYGIPANYPTLGEMDFSQWPAWFISTVDLHPGSAGALYGSGSIGGTVLLDSRANSGQSDSPLIVRIENGSFGYNFIGAKSYYGSGSWSGNTKIYVRELENDFTYKYRGEKFRLTNARSLDYGIQQQVGYQKENQSILLDAMFTMNDREVQPTKETPNAESKLETENMRVALVHKLDRSISSWNNTLSAMRFSTLFTDSLRTTSNQYSWLCAYAFSLSENISAQVGLNANAFLVQSSNYSGIARDIRTSLFTSIKWEPLDWWSSCLNLRQSFYKSNKPFTPSLGSEFTLIENDRWKILVTEQIGTGFKYPTLNQLHWQPGGNPNLVPEESFSIEGGLRLKRKSDHLEADLSVQTFKTWSKNWIYWIPEGGISIPENLRNVTIQGIELTTKIALTGGLARHTLNVSYALNRSLNQEVPNKGNQMIYVPVHATQGSYNILCGGWSGTLSCNYTGSRFTTFDNAERFAMSEFTLFDLKIHRSFEWWHKEMASGICVRNLLNVDYENVRNLAMPGRNYQIQLSIKL